MKIGIVGFGILGKGFYRVFSDWVYGIYDPFNPNLPIPSSKEKVNECDLVLVCVPTPMSKDGRCDTSLVEESVDWIKSPLILIKSTIEPGTTDRLIKKTGKKICFSPEYMGESKYFTPPWLYPDPENAISHGFMVIGGEQEVCEEIIQPFVRKMGPHTKFVMLTAKEAECVKYWENIWGAMKVTFANEMYDCLKALGVTYYKTREGWAVDPRVERMHTAVFSDARGFSGKCYPKDLRAFIYAVEQSGFNPKLLKTIWNLNCEYRLGEFKKIK
jgi:nucleotide sugar dehydrogenase